VFTVAVSRRLSSLALALFITVSCVSQPATPPIDPDAEVAAASFAAALRMRDPARLQEFFAATVRVVDTSYAGRSNTGATLSRDELVTWYAALFEKLGPSRWSDVMRHRKSELLRSFSDGHHFPLARTGDHVLTLLPPESQKLELEFVFVFRNLSGEYKLVAQSKAFE
jgi:hypothetical protein